MTNLEDPQWMSVTVVRDSGRLNLNLALIATSIPSALLITTTMKFFTIFVATAWLVVLAVWFLDPRRPGEFFLTYHCWRCVFIEWPPVYPPQFGKLYFIYVIFSLFHLHQSLARTLFSSAPPQGTMVCLVSFFFLYTFPLTSHEM